MNQYSHQPLTAEDAQQARDHLDRAQREEREWMEAQLHQSLHGKWDRESCPACINDALDAQIERATNG